MRTRFGRFVRFTLALGFALGLGEWQASAQVVDYTYTTNNGSITITEYSGSGGDVIIPNTINGLPVTAIGGILDTVGLWHGAFQVSSVTSVTIPDSVTTIGDEAFRGCRSLTSVTIPDSVTSIGQLALGGCSSLTSFRIPNRVGSIGNLTFRFCTSLTNITIPNSITSIGGEAFSHCTSLTNITIPDSVTSIGPYAFAFCFSLTSFTIPDSVTSIGDSGFESCLSLTRVTVGNGVISIAERTFWNCTSLTNITIHNSVTSLGSYAFAHCTSLAGFYSQGNAPSIGFNVFASANNATVYYLPGTTGWDTTFGGRPTALWVLSSPYPMILNGGPNFGVQTNGFGFSVYWATNSTVVVETSTSLANPNWAAVSTNTLTDGWSYFRDPDWTNYPSRFYRVRSQ